MRACLDRSALAAQLRALGLATIEVASEAGDRATYLRRPDLGRRLDASSRDILTATAGGEGQCDVALLIGDGLSATAVAAHAPVLVEALLPELRRLEVSLGPVVIAKGARVALGDEVGEILRARLVAVLIGERPGLSSADSLGIYLTWSPRPGRSDAERNCISNVRPGGLAPKLAAGNLAWLINAALSLQTTGVTLKDRSGSLAAAEVAGEIGISRR